MVREKKQKKIRTGGGVGEGAAREKQKNDFSLAGGWGCSFSRHKHDRYTSEMHENRNPFKNNCPITGRANDENYLKFSYAFFLAGVGGGGCSFSRHKHEKKTSASQANKKVLGSGSELNEAGYYTDC